MTKSAARLSAASVVLAASLASASAQTIIEQWGEIKAPPPPKVAPVTIEPATTALLLLDFTKQVCARNPNCVAALPRVATLLKGARDSNTMVVYSTTPAPATPADILPPLQPTGNEPVVASHADKFLDTELEKILKDKGIKTVIVAGTAANGAVLYTGSHAALEGFDVIVPIDTMIGPSSYAEQYVAWNMLNAPGVGQKSKLTQSGMVKF